MAPKRQEKQRKINSGVKKKTVKWLAKYIL